MNKVNSSYIFLTTVLMSFVSISGNAATTLYGVVGGPQNSGAVAGSLVTLDQVTGAATVLGAPISNTGITGLVVDNAGRLIGSTSRDGGPPRLIEIDSSTGGLVGVIATITFGGSNQPVTDLAFDPTTNTLYGNGAFGPVGGNNALLQIDLSTGVATFVGRTISAGGFKAIAFDSSGTLYLVATNNAEFIHTIDPSNASILTTTAISPATGGALGLTVDPVSGDLFLTNGDGPRNAFGRRIYRVDAATGQSQLLGSGLPGNVHDLAFLVDTDGDGVNDDADLCDATVIAEGVPTSGVLNPNHWALTDDDGDFDTVLVGMGKGPNRSYTIEDTAGCSCEQIIEMQELGDGHSKHGCSISAMDDWVEAVNQ